MQPEVEEKRAACGRRGGRKREQAFGRVGGCDEGGRDLRVIWSLYL